jgi:glycosyltransferase involved in cell wall biosynthesis
VDAGSRDGTVEIIKKHSARISRWISEPDKGLADAWNKGLAMAKGDVIGLLNADDLYEPRAVEKAVNALRSGEMALTYGDAVMFTDDTAAPDGIIAGRFDPSIIQYGFGFMHTTCFTTRRVYQEIGGFDLRYRIAVDTDFLLRCHMRGVEFRKTDVVTYMRNGGMSQKQRHAAYMEYLAQLYRHGYPRLRILRAWASHVRQMSVFRSRAAEGNGVIPGAPPKAG